jgi:hypothetical protein
MGDMVMTDTPSLISDHIEGKTYKAASSSVYKLARKGMIDPKRVEANTFDIVDINNSISIAEVILFEGVDSFMQQWFD